MAGAPGQMATGKHQRGGSHFTGQTQADYLYN